MNYLRQSTASQAVLIGPYTDDTDFKTAETGLTIANTDLRLSANGGNMFAKTSGGGTHDEAGWYAVTFDATDTATVGRLQVSSKIAGALHVWAEFQVLEEVVYDDLFKSGAVGYVAEADLSTDAEIADAIWDEAKAGHTTADTYGKLTQDIETTTDKFVFTVANQVDANAVAISDDATAADNLEAMYDGDGYIDDTGPASRAQVNSIGSLGGGSANIKITSDNTGGAIKGVTFVGVETSGTFASTQALDGVYHVIDDTGNAIDIVYGVDIGGTRIGSAIGFDGFLNSANDELTVQAYDFVAAGWSQIGVLLGQGGSGTVERSYPLLIDHTGSGVDLGIVYIRFQNTGQTNPTFNPDRIFCSAAARSTTIGYEGGAVWIDTNASNTNTEPDVDGTAGNPVSTIAAATTIAASKNIKIFHLVPLSSITLAQTYSGFEFMGAGFTVNCGSQDVGGSRFIGGTVTGIAVNTSRIVARECLINALTANSATLIDCSINGTLTLAEAADYVILDSNSNKSDTVFEFGALVGNTDIYVHSWSGDFQVNNLGATGTDLVHAHGEGEITLAASCVGGTVDYGGTFVVTNNGSGITLAPGAAINVDLILDEALSGHTTAGTLGKAISDTETDVTAILVDTGTTIPATLAGLNDISVADILASQLTESYAADGAAPTLTQALMLIQQQLGDFSISGTTMTVKKVDGSTTAGTFTLSDATNPTSITRAT